MCTTRQNTLPVTGGGDRILPERVTASRTQTRLLKEGIMLYSLSEHLHFYVCLEKKPQGRKQKIPTAVIVCHLGSTGNYGYKMAMRCLVGSTVCIIQFDCSLRECVAGPSGWWVAVLAKQSVP